MVTSWEGRGARGGGWTCEGRFIGRSASQPRVRGKREVERGKNRKREHGGTGAATSVDSHPGPRDALVVRSARAKAGYHRHSPADTCGRWTPFSKWPTAHIQLKLQSYTSSCLRMVGYAATARNPVPPISLCLLCPKGSLRFAPSLHPPRNPFLPFV